MTIDDMSFSFSFLQWLVTAAIGIYSWFISRQAASAKELLELRARLIKLEEAARHAPSHSLVSDLHGDMKALKAEMQTMSKSLNRMNDYLMRSK